MRTFKIYFLRNFQIYNTILLTVVTMPYITSPRLICLITGSLYLLTTFTHFSHSPTPTSGNHQSIPCIYESSFFKILLISEVIWYLSFSVWLISLSIMPSGSIRVAANGRICFFFYGWIIFYCIYTPHFLSPFICWWTLRLLHLYFLFFF